MLAVFLDAVLPVFAVAALGFTFGRFGFFDASMAAAINRFVFYVALPLLLFRLVVTAPFERFEWSLLVAYGLAEAAIYTAGFLVARFGFRRSKTESLLLGMSCGFANHVFFVLPIVRQLYGETAAMPVTALITLDTLVLVGTVLILEATSDAAKGMAPLDVLRLFARNPPILAIAAAAVATLAAMPLRGGLELFTRLLGETAAPCSLFSLGVVMASRFSTSYLAPASAFAVLKLAVMPLAIWALLETAFPVSAEWAGPAMMAAAGPSGTMPFVLGLQYKAPVETVTATILITTLGSLVAVTLMTQAI
jgi:malonate transporter